jgi:PadR family transcriptional regulator, regulatory protein PadR
MPKQSTETAILEALIDAHDTGLSALEICAKAGLPGGTIHPDLARLEAREWITSSWGEPLHQGGPRPRLYRLTPSGRVRGHHALGHYGWG